MSYPCRDIQCALRRMLRLGLLCLVVAGVLAPRVSAALTTVMPGFMTVVICTGTQMITLTLGPDGTPVSPQETTSAPCVLSDLAQSAPAQIPAWRALELPHARLFAIKTAPMPPVWDLAHSNPSRAPPVIL